jgi:O-antigen chain-terminating methyltransferase
MAVLSGKVIIYLSSFITDKQKSFNYTVIHALRALTNRFDRLSYEISKTIRNETKGEIQMLKDSNQSLQNSFKSDNELQRKYLMQLDTKIKKLSEDILHLKSSLEKESELFPKSLYLSFENKFRGTREEIKERQRIFLPYIIRAGAGTEKYPVLDLGCGRGEWLELLGENGLKGTGVDFNRVMVSVCKDNGLNALESDCLTFLSEQKTQSIGAVTGFHLIEHLSFNKIIKLLEESIRILKTGGVAIFETPNPQNILVGSYDFYMDPTHQKPLPSPLIRFLAEESSLSDIEILDIHPSREKLDKTDSSNSLNDHFYGPQDYAIIGFKKV